jgi:phosphoserine phosphatase
MPGAAFFDLDKTLMAGSSGMVFARVANQRGFVPRGQLARWGWDHLRYRLRGSSDEQTNAVLDVAKKVFAEMPERDVERMAPAVLAGILPRIYPQMLDEVHRHQDEGRATFIVSAAGNDLVRALAAVLGMQGEIGTAWAVATGTGFLRWKVPEDVGTHRVLLLDGEMPGVLLQERLSRVVKASGEKPPLPEYLRISAADLYRDGLPDLIATYGTTASRSGSPPRRRARSRSGCTTCASSTARSSMRSVAIAPICSPCSPTGCCTTSARMPVWSRKRRCTEAGSRRSPGSGSVVTATPSATISARRR